MSDPSPFRDRKVGEFLGGWTVPEAEIDTELAEMLAENGESNE